ncbi:hypothetical protein PsYK624_169560 [Phanerochaete sordida]|uniref:Uncharacterized protein n=1 Tax=Phanerochaete sordida TaxID=48140 RepID=A0A9P3LNU7_9APHY|nr:hypothetical protein PsYK624_169560 [Phanerochaete sordida]
MPDGKWCCAFWKYNMPEHIRTCHKGYSADGVEPGASLLDQLLIDMEIKVLEEQLMKIPKDRIPQVQLIAPLATGGTSARAKALKRSAAENLAMAMKKTKQRRVEA